MKKNFVVLLFLGILTISCEGNHESKLNRMVGTWLLDKMVYENAAGKTIEVNDSKIMLILKDEDEAGNKTGGNEGSLIVDEYEESYNFTYSFDFSGNKVDLSFEPDDVENLPLEAVGKVQLYDFELINKNTLEISTDFEMVHSNNEVLKNVTYTFVRKQ